MIKYFATSNQISADLTGNTVILQTEVSEYFGLNEVGTRIWAMLQLEPQTISDLVRNITDVYEVDDEQCQKDVEAIIERLQQESLVEIS